MVVWTVKDCQGIEFSLFCLTSSKSNIGLEVKLEIVELVSTEIDFLYLVTILKEVNIGQFIGWAFQVLKAGIESKEGNVIIAAVEFNEGIQMLQIQTFQGVVGNVDDSQFIFFEVRKADLIDAIAVQVEFGKIGKTVENPRGDCCDAIILQIDGRDWMQLNFWSDAFLYVGNVLIAEIQLHQSFFFIVLSILQHSLLPALSLSQMLTRRGIHLHG